MIGAQSDSSHDCGSATGPSASTGTSRLHAARRDDRTAGSAPAAADLLVLSQCEYAPRVRGTTGLYHFAILVPSRTDLSHALRRLVATGHDHAGRRRSRRQRGAVSRGRGRQRHRDLSRSAARRMADRRRPAADGRRSGRCRRAARRAAGAPSGAGLPEGTGDRPRAPSRVAAGRGARVLRRRPRVRV